MNWLKNLLSNLVVKRVAGQVAKLLTAALLAHQADAKHWGLEFSVDPQAVEGGLVLAWAGLLEWAQHMLERFKAKKDAEKLGS